MSLRGFYVNCLTLTINYFGSLRGILKDAATALFGIVIALLAALGPKLVSAKAVGEAQEHGLALPVKIAKLLKRVIAFKLKLHGVKNVVVV